MHRHRNRRRSTIVRLSATIAALACLFAVAPSPAAESSYEPHAGMTRYPDVSASHIVFVYANDVWLVPREGGTATPLASPDGLETFPRFSPDGKHIAFVGNYDGNRDLYVIPADGGVPRRVTHHPASETLCDWTPDGRLLFFSNGLASLGRQEQLFTVSSQGGLPEKLPVPYGANGSISSDGKWLAYTPHTRDHRTWKRYQGGMATDIWLFHLTDHQSRKITDWQGTDSQPMWHGDRVYYLSDAGPTPRLNIWSFDSKSGRKEQLTRFDNFDVKWPSIGPGPDGRGEIVFQHGPDLMLLNLATGKADPVNIRIPGDRPRVRDRAVDASKFIDGAAISPTGKRAVVEARGDIWTLPAKHGTPRNLTRTSSAAERDPSWSPDGQWIAYFSDESGEYELYVAQSDGRGEARRLTRNGNAYRYSPAWSPDSKLIAFSDKSGAMFIHDIADDSTRQFDVELYARPARMSWSPDSRWIAYAKGGDNRLTSVWIYDVESDQARQVTAGMFGDSWPTFDREGKYLALASNREFSSPIYEDVGTTFVYAGTDRLYLVPLRDDLASPWAPKSDEEKWNDTEDEKDEEDKPKKDDDSDDEPENGNNNENDNGDEPKDENGKEESADAENDKEADDDKDDSTKKDKEVKPVKIDFDGFERRAIAVPVDRGAFSHLAFNHKNHLIYLRRTPRGVEGDPVIQILDLEDEDKKEKQVVEDVQGFSISADGKKLLVFKPRTMAIVDASPDQKLDKNRVSTDAMTAMVSPREEWKQMFHEAWRVQRDFFYDPTMHGVDWPAMRDHYAAMLDDCASREDLDFVIGELIAELNVGHAYVRGGGDYEDEPEVEVGLLGCDFDLDNGAYRITRIYEGGTWDIDARGPLSQPGVEVSEGDYLLAVNGVPVDTARDPWAALQGLAGRTLTLTVSNKPSIDDEARTVVVKSLKPDEERDLRYRAWIEANRRYVAEQSDNRIGYIYVPNTGVQGQNELFRQFYGQRDKAALIIDERWNGGGQIPTRFVELLDRPVVNYWARRDGLDGVWPPDAHHGPKCMLINGLAGSGGDYFPFYFRERGVGKLIGTRTWGGLVGISGNPSLIDGGRVTAPTFAFYETDGTWGIEGHGVEPDIEVVDDPAMMVDGGDPQIDAAIKHLNEELKVRAYVAPKRPAYPDRSGIGITDQDR